jgi:hypothetical protein
MVHESQTYADAVRVNSRKDYLSYQQGVQVRIPQSTSLKLLDYRLLSVVAAAVSPEPPILFAGTACRVAPHK